MATSTCCFLSNDDRRSCMVTRSCVSVEKPEQNPWFSEVKIRPRGYKTFFKLSSAEHEISTAHKC